MRKDLVAWQWQLYPDNHATRRNLVIHVLTVPLFQLGTVALGLGALAAWWLPLAGLGAMALAMAAQGRGHAGEPVPPVPFDGPADVVRRIFAEQWLTWPRFLLSGGLRAAWHRSAG